MTGPFRNPNPPLAPAKPAYSLQPQPVAETMEQKLQRLRELEDEYELREGLPFLYGWKWYPWAREFYESTNHVNLLCAANQISKSSTQIRKCINWATNTDLWSDLWVTRPNQFWYLYPTKEQVNAEFLTKWMEFLPRGKYKDDPKYGWKEIKKHGDTLGIAFNSGVYVFFKTYAQNAVALQTGTCQAIFCDEELPVNLYEELMFRVSAANGYFHMVFTATLGQDFWRRAMEPAEDESGKTDEVLPQAWKKTVSLYDAMFYEDGSASHWTAEKIALVRARCSTDAEVEKRVYGKFIVVGGRKYEAFDIKRHMKTPHPIPKGWFIFVGADIGSGGKEGHPSALCYIAVRPDFRAARVFLGWRGDGIPTTAGDVVNKHAYLVKEKKIENFGGMYYDHGCRDFFEIATRNGIPFQPANKSHDVGEEILNTLFKHDMLLIYEDEETVKLGGELATLKKLTPKNKAKDDFCDALRYGVSLIPWDWSAITGEVQVQDDKPKTELEQQIIDRRKEFEDGQADEEERVNNEFAEWNEAYDGF